MSSEKYLRSCGLTCLSVVPLTKWGQQPVYCYTEQYREIKNGTGTSMYTLLVPVLVPMPLQLCNQRLFLFSQKQVYKSCKHPVTEWLYNFESQSFWGFIYDSHHHLSQCLHHRPPQCRHAEHHQVAQLSSPIVSLKDRGWAPIAISWTD